MYSAKISTEVVFQIYIRMRYNTIVVIVVKDMVLGWLLEVNISTSRPSFFSQPFLLGKCNNNSLYFTSVKKTLFH